MLTPKQYIKLNCMDCIEFLHSLQDESVDMTLTSPPYDNLRNYGGHEFRFHLLAHDLFRVTKKGGVVIWVVGDSTIHGSETGTSFRQALFFQEVGWRLNDTMIYAKNNPLPTQGQRYHQAFEYMFCFSKGKPKTFNPIDVESKYGGKVYMKNRGQSGAIKYKIKQRTKRHKVTNIFTYSIGGGISTKDKIAYQHPAIFPEELAKDQILTWSDPDDIICDPLFGSGTTPKMCMLNYRRFVGAEIVKSYYDIALKRLDDARQESLRN